METGIPLFYPLRDTRSTLHVRRGKDVAVLHRVKPLAKYKAMIKLYLSKVLRTNKMVLPVILLVLLPGLCLHAQQKSISGRVTDKASLPLAGVSVTIKNETTGTATGADGSFTIQVQPGCTLLFPVGEV